MRKVHESAEVRPRDYCGLNELWANAMATAVWCVARPATPRAPHLQRALVEEASRDDEAVAAQRGQLPRAEHLGHRRADSDAALIGH